MIYIAIATKSHEKIEGIKTAITQFFDMEESEMRFFTKSIDSGVREQPFGDETYLGALNRVNGIKKEFPEMDFYISCEAGIETAFNQYFNVQVVCVFENSSQSFLWGKSSGWSIPSEAIEEIEQTNLDSYLRRKGITSIEQLLGTSNSRRAAVAQATELALASGKLRNN